MPQPADFVCGLTTCYWHQENTPMCGLVSMLGFKHTVPETDEAGEMTGEYTEEYLTDQWVWVLEHVPRSATDIQHCPFRSQQEVLQLCYDASLHINLISVQDEPNWDERHGLDKAARGVQHQYPKVTVWKPPS